MQNKDELRKCQNKYNEIHNKLQLISQQEDETLNKMLEQLKKSNKELKALKEKNIQLQERIKQLEDEIINLKGASPSK